MQPTSSDLSIERARYHSSRCRTSTSSSLLYQICFRVFRLASCQNISSSGKIVTNTLFHSGNAIRSKVSILPSFTIPKVVLSMENSLSISCRGHILERQQKGRFVLVSGVFLQHHLEVGTSAFRMAEEFEMVFFKRNGRLHRERSLSSVRYDMLNPIGGSLYVITENSATEILHWLAAYQMLAIDDCKPTYARRP